MIWRHSANVLQTRPFLTSDPVTSTLRHLMAWSEPATVSVDALVDLLVSDADVAGVGEEAEAEATAPTVRIANRRWRIEYSSISVCFQRHFNRDRITGVVKKSLLSTRNFITCRVCGAIIAHNNVLFNGREMRVPHVENKNGTNSVTVIPCFMFNGVIEGEGCANLP